MDIKELIAAIPMTDTERAKSFYEKTLGFELETLSKPLNMYWVKKQTSKFLLYKREETTKAEHTVISFTVGNIKKTVQALEGKGVKFYEDAGTKIFNLDGSLSAWFQDTEGNNLEISQRAVN